MDTNPIPPGSTPVQGGGLSDSSSTTRQTSAEPKHVTTDTMLGSVTRMRSPAVGGDHRRAAPKRTPPAAPDPVPKEFASKGVATVKTGHPSQTISKEKLTEKPETTAETTKPRMPTPEEDPGIKELEKQYKMMKDKGRLDSGRYQENIGAPLQNYIKARKDMFTNKPGKFEALEKARDRLEKGINDYQKLTRGMTKDTQLTKISATIENEKRLVAPKKRTPEEDAIQNLESLAKSLKNPGKADRYDDLVAKPLQRYIEARKNTHPSNRFQAALELYQGIEAYQNATRGDRFRFKLGKTRDQELPKIRDSLKKELESSLPKEFAHLRNKDFSVTYKSEQAFEFTRDLSNKRFAAENIQFYCLADCYTKIAAGKELSPSDKRKLDKIITDIVQSHPELQKDLDAIRNGEISKQDFRKFLLNHYISEGSTFEINLPAELRTDTIDFLNGKSDNKKDQLEASMYSIATHLIKTDLLGRPDVVTYFNGLPFQEKLDLVKDLRKVNAFQ